MNNSINLLENFLEQQKQKYVIAGAYGALGLALLVILATRGGKSSLSASSSRNEKEEKSSKKSGSQSNGTACVGSYHVSGYTRADGTEVSDYTRTCGAKHLGKTKVLQGHVEKNDVIENIKTVLHEKSETYRHYEDLEPIEVVQKMVTKLPSNDTSIPLKEYYKLSLNLADNPEKVVSNERYQVYKVEDLPDIYDENVVYDKISKGLNLDLNKPENKVFVKNIRVVIPNQNSKLIELIKKSDEIKNILKKENENIELGVYENKYFKSGVEFKKPTHKDISSKSWTDKATLFGVIHNADIFDMKQNEKGGIDFVITDFYDFESWDFNKNYNAEDWGIKNLNNNAYWQQETGHLMPYVLYIPIEYSIDEIWDILMK